MRCRTCDYPLWNLPTRVCPECGTAFKPSDFHFVPNSVRFCCPQCDQEYYGTTEHGQLIPRTFNCVRCGKRIDMDEMVLRPAAGVEESHTSADVMPWLERKHIGWFRGWWKTVLMAMVAPQRVMKATPIEAATGEAWFFMLVTQALTFACGAGLPLLGIALIDQLAGGGRGAPHLVAQAAIVMVGGTIATAVLVALWGICTHGLLMISGGCEQRLGRTYQAILYGSGANIVSGVPCLGMYFGWILWIWWLVSSILMVMQAQRVKALRATLCVGLPPVLLTVGVLAWLVIMVVTVTRTISAGGPMGAAGSGGYIATPEAITVGSGILAWAQQHNGQGPPHGVQLVADGQLPATTFVMGPLGHDEDKVVVADGTLGALQLLPPNRMQLAAQAAAATLPSNVIAHRVGDVVFTYHGINLNRADPALWIAIIYPDPSLTATSWPVTPVAARADGGIQPLLPSIAGALQQQNMLRRKHHLPPLPDPATVLDTQPAVPAAQPSAGP